MPIQPYFPEPLTVPGNVAETRHKARVSFVRRVVGWHFLSAAIVAAVAALLPVALTPGKGLALAFGGLCLLSLARRVVPSGKSANALSALILAPTLFWLAQGMDALAHAGWPAWILGAVPAGAAGYALLCGNDFSYIGQFGACSLFVAGFATWAKLERCCEPLPLAQACGVALAYQFYYVYDLSMLVKRRRLGEEASAVADLYRDVLNFATYSVRVALHWRRFRHI